MKILRLFSFKSGAGIRAGPQRVEKGATFIELLLVAALIGVVAAAAYPVITSTKEYYKTDSALHLVLSSIRETRQDALDGRRSFRMTFTFPGSFTIWRQDAAFSWVRDRQLSLPENISFTLPSGIPRIPVIPNSSDIDFGGSNTFRFQADGSAVNNSGQIISGLVYISNSGKSEECRAVSVFGGTGLTRAWIYEDGQWK